MKTLCWAWFVAVELISLAATILGWLVLLPFCWLRAWETSPVPSIDQKPWLKRGPIDRWKWTPLGLLYGNPADGVSGQTALVWGSGQAAGTLVPYWPSCPFAWLRAYAWSAWRNSAGGLKYTLAWRGSNPPYASGSFSLFGRTWSYGIGWKAEAGGFLPVLSVKP
ncbi:MAG: hypothetical protein ACRD41_05835 [Candidatus Acidiferrales bacterium]